MPIFGKSTMGQIGDWRLAYDFTACQFICPENAVATQISAYVALFNNIGISQVAKAAIYSDLDGHPYSLLGESQEIVVGPYPGGWYDFPLVTSIIIPANTTVWLCLITPDIYRVFYDTVTQVDQTQALLPSSLGLPSYPTFPPLIPGVQESFPWEISIYATYTPTSIVYVNLTVVATTGGTTDTGYPPSSYPIVQGSQITITATPNSGYLFDHWEVDGVSVGAVNPYIISMDANHTLTAVFTQIPPIQQYNLTVNSNPQSIPFTLEKIG